MIYARAAYELLKTGPGLLALAVFAVWFSHAWGQWQGASERSSQIAILKGSIAAIERDRADNQMIAKRDAKRVLRLLKLNSDLKEINEKNMDALNRAKISKSCNACRISPQRVRLLDNLPKTEYFSLRGAVK